MTSHPRKAEELRLGQSLQRASVAGAEALSRDAHKVRGAMGVQLLSAILAFYILEKAAGEQR